MLGPLQVTVDGVAVVVSAGKERAVLAVLALRAGEVVTAFELTAALWGDEPPVSAVKTVQNYVARLRRLLGAAAVVTVDRGYRLAAADSDAVRFVGLVNKGREAVAAGRPVEAEAVFVSALALWRGPPLADLADGPWAQGEVARLEQLRLAAIEDRFDAALVAGAAVGCAEELSDLVAEFPFRERLWSQLMVVLYRGGRQRDALDVYQQARRALVDSLGVEPSRLLRDTEQAVLAHDDRVLAWCPVEAVGDRSVDGPSRVDSLPFTREAARAAPFVGRESALAVLAKAWKQAVAGDSEVVLLSGEAGIGKSRLASEAELAVSEPAWLLFGRCDEDMAVPYQPFIEALRLYVKGCADGALREALGPHPEYLLRLVPELTDRLPQLEWPPASDAETDRYRLFEAVRGWLGAAARRE